MSYLDAHHFFFYNKGGQKPVRIVVPTVAGSKIPADFFDYMI